LRKFPIIIIIIIITIIIIINQFNLPYPTYSPTT